MESINKALRMSSQLFLVGILVALGLWGWSWSTLGILVRSIIWRFALGIVNFGIVSFLFGSHVGAYLSDDPPESQQSSLMYATQVAVALTLCAIHGTIFAAAMAVAGQIKPDYSWLTFIIGLRYCFPKDHVRTIVMLMEAGIKLENSAIAFAKRIAVSVAGVLTSIAVYLLAYVFPELIPPLLGDAGVYLLLGVRT